MIPGVAERQRANDAIQRRFVDVPLVEAMFPGGKTGVQGRHVGRCGRRELRPQRHDHALVLEPLNERVTRVPFQEQPPETVQNDQDDLVVPPWQLGKRRLAPTEKSVADDSREIGKRGEADFRIRRRHEADRSDRLRRHRVVSGLFIDRRRERRFGWSRGRETDHRAR